MLVVQDAEGKPILNGTGSGEYHERNARTQANLLRAIACVNACAGMADPATEIAKLRAYDAIKKEMTRLQQLLDLHSTLLAENPYCYFELAYTRQTAWMAWLCSKSREEDPGRKVLAQGQGFTPEAAADAALESFVSEPPAATGFSGLKPENCEPRIHGLPAGI